MDFEWDTAKSAANFAKHGVSFQEAKAVFSDPFALELRDDRADYGEERYILIGQTPGGVLVVVHTQRDTRIRLISARNAEPRERRAYHDNTR